MLEGTGGYRRLLEDRKIISNLHQFGSTSTQKSNRREKRSIGGFWRELEDPEGSWRVLNVDGGCWWSKGIPLLWFIEQHLLEGTGGYRRLLEDRKIISNLHQSGSTSTHFLDPTNCLDADLENHASVKVFLADIFVENYWNFDDKLWLSTKLLNCWFTTFKAGFYFLVWKITNNHMVILIIFVGWCLNNYDVAKTVWKMLLYIICWMLCITIKYKVI